MHSLKHDICHFRPAMSRLQSELGSFNTGIGFSQARDGPFFCLKSQQAQVGPPTSDEPSKL